MDFQQADHQEENRISFRSSLVVEGICAVLSILCFEHRFSERAETLLGKERVRAFRQQYGQLAEILHGFRTQGYELLEFFLIVPEFDQLDAYVKGITALDGLDFFYTLFGGDIERTKLADLLSGDMTPEAFCQAFPDRIKLASLTYLLSRRQAFIKAFFECVSELMPLISLKRIPGVEKALVQEAEKIARALENTDPLELSQQIMGKTFYRRGPYQRFIFIPVYFLPNRGVRFMDQDQMLLYKLLPDVDGEAQMREEESRLQTGLKALGDWSRFELLKLLKEKGPLMGKEIAEASGLATPTISYHMEQLREAGFLHEERVKNAKYFSVNHRQVEAFLASLGAALKKE